MCIWYSSPRLTFHGYNFCLHNLWFQSYERSKSSATLQNFQNELGCWYTFLAKICSSAKTINLNFQYDLVEGSLKNWNHHCRITFHFWALCGHLYAICLVTRNNLPRYRVNSPFRSHKNSQKNKMMIFFLIGRWNINLELKLNFNVLSKIYWLKSCFPYRKLITENSKK